MPKISIVILTYNSSRHILKLLQSLENIYEKNNLEIIIADNASDDDTLEIAQKSNLIVKVREFPSNIGFAAGINAGAKFANGEYLLFLNPDTSYKSGDLSKMIDMFSDSKIGVIGGKMMNGEVSENSAGKELNLYSTLLIIFGLDDKLSVRYSPEKNQEVGFVSGGFMMIKTELFKKLNGFDEDFFMYVEDADLSKRVKDLGLKTFFTPSVVIDHKPHGSSSREFAVTNICKGLILYHEKHSSKFVKTIVKYLLKLKAYFLVLIGKLVNNNYLVDAYIDVTKL